MPVAMILYQILMALALPFILTQALWRGGPAAVLDRLGFSRVLPPGPCLWLHGASVGEVTSARWVIEAVRAARPEAQILVTTNTLTGRDLVAGWGLVGVRAALAPMDGAGAAERLLDKITPQALVIIENELWPARIAAAHRRGVPVLVIGARLSDRSAARWRHLPGLIGPLLARIDWLSPQDGASAQSLVALGLPRSALGPTVTLKAQVLAQVLAQDRPPPFAAPAPRAATLLAASTHPGEEAAILSAFATARMQGGPQLLILAPRHPARGDEVAALITAAGLRFARRALGQVPDATTLVFLADTLGEMALWYQMAGICLIGGSFADLGGHTPFEPAGFDCALIHGPSVHNFAPQFAALDRAGGALALRQIAELTGALPGLDAARQGQLAQAARAGLAPFAAGAEAIPNRLLHYLPRA